MSSKQFLSAPFFVRQSATEKEEIVAKSLACEEGRTALAHAFVETLKKHWSTEQIIDWLCTF